MSSRSSFERRRSRVRHKLKNHSAGAYRLSVHRSSKHIYAQLIDDVNSSTLFAASTLDKDFSGLSTSSIQAAEAVGKKIAEKASNIGDVKVVFDRGGYIFHGRVKALADGARAAGMKF